MSKEYKKDEKKHQCWEQEKAELLDMKTICIIPARKGSKRLPNKNMLDFGGVTLAEHSIKIAKKCNVDKIILTTDIKDFFGLEVVLDITVIKRKKKLCTDAADIIADVVIDAIQDYPDYELVLLRQPTQPLVTADTINKGIKIMKENPDLPALVSVNPSYEVNGDMYLIRRDVLLNKKTMFPEGMEVMVTKHTVNIDYLHEYRVAQAVSTINMKLREGVM